MGARSRRKFGKNEGKGKEEEVEEGWGIEGEEKGEVIDLK